MGKKNGTLDVLRDTDENMREITFKVKRLIKGCKCKKGCTRICGCRREGLECGPGCMCVNCTNKKDDINETTTEELVAQEQQGCSSDEDDSEKEYIDDIERHYMNC